MEKTVLVTADDIQIHFSQHRCKRRARQTAEILAAAVVPGREIEQLGGLGPNDPVEPFVRHVEEWAEDLLVVGHLPFMAKLAARLAAGSGERSIVAYRPGSIVCLDMGEETGWQVQWMIRPELLPEAPQR